MTSGWASSFPPTPHLVAWTRNRDHAVRLAERLDIETLPHVFGFAMGTMFRMRSEALQPFVDLGLKWADYPTEPIGMDATMLHAMDRLFGIHPVMKGWRAKVTNVTGLTR